MFNFYDTHTLLASIDQTQPATTFLKDRYFPTNAATDVFSTNDVLVEFREGSKKLAPFVAPRKGGVTILRDGYTMERYTPASIAPERPLTIDELEKRGFGEALYSKLTPEQRQGVIILRDLDEMRGMIRRREESMAANVMFTNGCIMKHIIDDQDHYEEKEIQFYNGSNEAIYTPSNDWDTTEAIGKQILSDIGAMVRLLTTKGLPARELLVGPETADILKYNEWIIKLLDNRRYELGNVAPIELPTGAAKIMTLNIDGRMIDVISYDETYEDEDGNVTSFIPEYEVVLTAPDAGKTLYGAVTQLEQADGTMHTYTGKYIPKYTSNAKTDTREVRLKSCPLLMPKNKNCFIKAKIK